MTRQPPSSLLFVCTGNICRSPTAEGVMRHALKERGLSLRLDSAGVASYHIGEAPDPRTQAMARRFGLDLCDLRARRLTPSDYTDFDIIFAMDTGHLQAIERMAPARAHAERALYLPYAGISSPRDMPDPYYGREADFREVYDLCVEATNLLLHRWFGG